MATGKRRRTPEEIRNSFNHQLDYLYRSCKAFDAGQENEALRLSTTLRVLLHQTDKSESLLKQMNALHQLAYVDSGVRMDLLTQAWNAFAKPGENYNLNASETGLVVPGFIGNEIKFIAPLSRNRFHPNDPRHSCIVATRDYQSWWTDKFIHTSSGHIYSRKEIVLTLANKEGGAHVDPEIEDHFDDLCQDSHNISGGSDTIPFQNVQANIAYSSVRQIAYEVMATFDDYFGTDLVARTQANNERPGWMSVPMPVAIISMNSDD